MRLSDLFPRITIQQVSDSETPLTPAESTEASYAEWLALSNDAMNSIVESCKGWIIDSLMISPIAISTGTTPLARHPAYDLLAQPKPGWSWRDLLEVAINAMIDDGLVYLVVDYDESGRPTALSPYTKGDVWNAWQADDDASPDAYTIRRGYYSETVPAERVAVVAYRRTKKGKAKSPLESVRDEIRADNQRARRTPKLLEQWATPSAIITPVNEGDTLNDDVARSISAQYRKYSLEWMGRAMVAKRRIQVHYPQPPRNQLDLSVIANIAEERACSVLRVSPVVIDMGVGMQQSRVGATVHEARMESWRGSSRPMQIRFATALTRLLSWVYRTPLAVEFDNSQVPVLAVEDENRKDAVADRSIKLYESGMLGLVEGRLMNDLDPALPPDLIDSETVLD